ncbi:MAG: hypothetical protein VKJ46_05095 [Leptolyngbyaceae bacterium]|nr:hypothetical protein [Leptolyngbyaceae bacterium]
MITTIRINGRKKVKRIIRSRLNPKSAEAKAISRLRDLNDPTQWETIIEIGEEIDIEANLEYFKTCGYKIQIPR